MQHYIEGYMLLICCQINMLEEFLGLDMRSPPSCKLLWAVVPWSALSLTIVADVIDPESHDFWHIRRPSTPCPCKIHPLASLVSELRARIYV